MMIRQSWLVMVLPISLMLAQCSVLDVAAKASETGVASGDDAQSTDLEITTDDSIPALSLDELDLATFRETIATGKWFIKFYAPWCKHCMALAPIWDELAKKIHSGPHDINIARMDCTKQSDICAAMMVKGYPTLRFIDGEIETQYKGIRALEGLEHFIARAIRPVLVDIPSVEELESIITDNPAFFVVLPGPKSVDDEWATPIQKLADSCKFESDVYSTTSDLVASHIQDLIPAGQGQPRLVSVRDDEFIRYNGKPQLLMMREFVKANRYPRTPDMNHIMASTLKKEYPHVLGVILVADTSSSDIHTIKATFKSVSKLKEWSNKFQFIVMDSNKWQLFIQKNWGSVAEATGPRIVVLNTQTQQYYALPSNTVNEDFSDIDSNILIDELRNVVSGKATFTGGNAFLDTLRNNIFSSVETFIVALAALEAEYPSLVQLAIITTLMLLAVLLKQCLCDSHKSKEGLDKKMK